MLGSDKSVTDCLEKRSGELLVHARLHAQGVERKRELCRQGADLDQIFFCSDERRGLAILSLAAQVLQVLCVVGMVVGQGAGAF